MALSALVVFICAISFDWAKWGDYRKCDEVVFRDDTPDKRIYCKKGKECPKGYWKTGSETTDNATCTKCKKAEDTDPDDSSKKIKLSDFCKNLGDYKTKYEGMYDEYEDANLACYCKSGKLKAGSCPANAKQIDKYRKDRCNKDEYKDSDECKKDYYKKTYKNCKKDKNYKGEELKYCKEGIKYGKAQTHYQGCLQASNKDRPSYWAVWAFILALALGIVGVLTIVIVIVVVVLMMGKKPKKAPVGPISNTGGYSDNTPQAQPVPEQVQSAGATDKAAEEEIAPEQSTYAAAAPAPAPPMEDLEESESG